MTYSRGEFCSQVSGRDETDVQEERERGLKLGDVEIRGESDRGQ